jgi:hypothetical protein
MNIFSLELIDLSELASFAALVNGGCGNDNGECQCVCGNNNGNCKMV